MGSKTNTFPKGSFEYIEAKIRRDADGMAFGKDFEWLCKWFLENAPRYRGQFERAWLWNDWPDRHGRDAGIDIVAQTRSGELWAIQAKADHPDRTITKREIDSFLSESNRRKFAYRLLMATTNEIGATARQTIEGQQKRVGLVLRGDFENEQVRWPSQIGGPGQALPKFHPKPHQLAAIKAVTNGFRKHDRGRLIMACGTGKTLTALWIAERLKSDCTLILVPSLSLVQQNLTEWGRHAAREFDSLVVCSDDSVVDRQDAAVQSISDLGTKATTNPAEIREFLNRRRNRPAVIFATYQSSERIAAAQTGKTKSFDLAICDEAHRLVGQASGLFATVLDQGKVKARKRLFMTATPRYFTERIKQQAADLEAELVSMDDEQAFGPQFHVLTFHDAITASPPLLTDYQVVVIGVTDREARAWADEARFVRTEKGLHTDARTLAAQIGLAKAIKKYDLRKIITFHSSVAKAERFVDATKPDSLPSVIPHMTRPARPAGKFWTKHISGHTPAGNRRSLLRGLGDLPDGMRGIISNCACLGEGVDVPVLDGVTFIDPKRSMVDIIQAVGRVIRKAENKRIGTIVIPVFIDETEDADNALSQSAFDPVWQVLKALRAHDQRLADELDELRSSAGRLRKAGGRITLPDRIRFDVPQLLLKDFEQAFYVRTVETATEKPPLIIEQILAWADAHKKENGSWPKATSGQVAGTDDTWAAINASLKAGSRGLPGQSSLAKLLAKRRGVRNIQDLPPLSVKVILSWADAHEKRTGDWPHLNSGSIAKTDETWSGIHSALKMGLRGLPGATSLAKFLAAHRDVRNHMQLPSLTVNQILSWADAHNERTGKWPNRNSGQVEGTDETWARIDNALLEGMRGLPGGSSLARLLNEYRDVRNHMHLPPLRIKRILDWADEHKKTIGEWPSKNSGRVTGTDETWAGIDAAFNRALRGLTGGTSLAKFLAKHRRERNTQDLPPLTVEQILKWADEHKAATGKWPSQSSGKVTATEETWLGINAALDRGLRGFKGGSSIAKLLAKHRGTRNRSDLPKFTVQKILAWADSHKRTTGDWPNKGSGRVIGTDETWAAIETALRRGSRGLVGPSSVAQLLAEYHRKRNPKDLSLLTIKQILTWAHSHRLQTGEWPIRNSGQVEGTDETWARIDNALLEGLRGLPGGSSLAKLLGKHRRDS